MYCKLQVLEGGRLERCSPSGAPQTAHILTVVEVVGYFWAVSGVHMALTSVEGRL